MNTIFLSISLGSAADWGGVMISIAGFILVYSTFQSQISVEKMQQRLARIELNRYLKEIRPDFNLSFDQVPELQGYVYNITLKPIVAVPTSKIKYEFHTTAPNFRDVSYYSGYINTQEVQIGELISIMVSFNHPLGLDDRVTYMKLFYKDSDDNDYQINLDIYLTDVPSQSIKKEGPILLNLSSKNKILGI